MGAAGGREEHEGGQEMGKEKRREVSSPCHQFLDTLRTHTLQACDICDLNVEMPLLHSLPCNNRRWGVVFKY